MGRIRKARLDLPERVYFRHGSYFFVDKAGTWLNLGKEYAKAMLVWAEKVQPIDECTAIKTVGDLLNRYIREVVPTKAPPHSERQFNRG